MSRELLIKLADALYDFDDSNPLLREVDEALAKLNKPEPKPDYWHVVDEDGNSIYSATFKEACHDHIKEAQLSDDIYFAVEVASKWVVRPLWSKPQTRAEPKPLTDAEIKECMLASCDLQSYEDVDWGWTTKKGLNENDIKFARAIEQKVWSKMK